MTRKVTDRLLMAEIATMQHAEAFKRWLKEAALKVSGDVKGQTPTEYLIIIGLMATLIIALFGMFTTPLKGGVTTFLGKVTKSLTGGG